MKKLLLPLLIFLFLSCASAWGAFPTNSTIFDNFNRTAEDPLSFGGKWTLWTGGAHLTNGTQLTTDSLGNGIEYWNPSTFTDSEVYWTIVTLGAKAGDGISLTARMQDLANGDWYEVYYQWDNNTWEIIRYDNFVSTTLGNTFVQAIAAGDSMGLSVVGSTITAWYKPSAGSWTSLATRTDTTYPNAGNIGFYGHRVGTTAWVIDDFGGGTVVNWGPWLDDSD